jgi:type II secretory pathway component GspD/PulD (secretin)
LIFIRPQVIRDAQEARDITDEFRSRMNIMKPMSQQGRDSYDRDFKRILR